MLPCGYYVYIIPEKNHAYHSHHHHISIFNTPFILEIIEKIDEKGMNFSGGLVRDIIIIILYTHREMEREWQYAEFPSFQNPSIVKGMWNRFDKFFKKIVKNFEILY